MSETVSYLTSIRDGYKVRVWVQPGAKRSQVVGLYQGCIKISLKAPPVDNKANKELVAFVAELLKIKLRQVRVESGQKSRKKVLILEMKHRPDFGLN